MKGSKVLFFDTETTGLPINWKAPVSLVDNWPRVIQLAFVVYIVDENGEPQFVEEQETLIKPDGWEIPKQKFWIDNGYTTERSLESGFPIVPALEYFLEWANDCDYLVAHNMSFDANVLGAEMIRAGMKASKPLKKICTKIASTDYCRLPQPNGNGFKWPKLEELHRVLFETDFEGAHDALNDVNATAKCFWEMVKRGLIELK